jgi:hypothetical protein
MPSENSMGIFENPNLAIHFSYYLSIGMFLCIIAPEGQFEIRISLTFIRRSDRICGALIWR